jgi:predicted metal-dependent hydrolase
MKTLTIEGLTFELRESSQRRTMEIIVDRDGSLVLAAPPHTPHETLLAFVEENQVWIHTKLLEKESQARPQARREYVSGEGFFYLGRSYRLKVIDGANQQAPLRLYQSRFELRRDALPRAREHFIRWYTVHLRPVLDRHIAALARRIEVKPREVHVRDLGYRWGSRGKRNHLYFHWRVAMLPPQMIEYVVAHELVHLRERSHSPAFWQRLERVIADYPDRQRWLKENGGVYDL